MRNRASFRSAVSSLALWASLALMAAMIHTGCSSKPAQPDAAPAPAATDATAQKKVTGPADAGAQEARPDAAPIAIAEEGPPVKTADLAAAQTGFAASLLAWMNAEGRLSTEHNLVFSPYSLHVALAMAQAGARGQTAAEMLKVLKLPESGRRHAAFEGQMSVLTAPPAQAESPLTLSINQGLWVQAGLAIVPAFKSLLLSHYGAPLSPVNFGTDPEAARGLINQAIAKQTRDRIKELIPQGEITPLTQFVLTNAVAFEGRWARPFQPRITRSGPFTGLDGQAIQTRYMVNTGVFAHRRIKGAALLALPYEGGNYEMVIVLPDEGQFEAIARDPAKTLQAALKDPLAHQNVQVELPRFAFTSDLKVADALQKLGMSMAFGDQADFSALVQGAQPGMFYLSQVIHQARIEVDEAGTRAEAATAVIGALRSAVVRSEQFKVNRPFFAVVRHVASDTPLFVAQVVRPEVVGEDP